MVECIHDFDPIELCRNDILNANIISYIIQNSENNNENIYIDIATCETSNWLVKCTT